MTVKNERPFEALIAFGMATLTARELWDTTGTDKFATICVAIAKEIIKNEDQIDELFEWINKKGRSGFSGESEIMRFTKAFL